MPPCAKLRKIREVAGPDRTAVQAELRTGMFSVPIKQGENMSVTEVKDAETTIGITAGLQADCDIDAHRMGETCQRLANRLPKSHPSRALLEQIADAISDALDTQ